ncbi:MAG: RNA 2',3'-cyclic phosphodiesterase [Candidatus Moranbacteria bacterium]|nr:RNA 2',3'-cyclic phosphodiesterase [Candidatus Moranbacteria bacterium]
MSKQRKVFVAINLDKKSKEFIYKKIKSLPIYREGNIKWIDPENYHVTLMFLGYLDDEDTYRVCRDLKLALSRQGELDLKFGRIKKAPREDNPKMIWLKGEENEDLADLRNKVEQVLSQRKIDLKKFTPHITLARIKKNAGETKNSPVDEKVNLMAPVRSIEVMESVEENGRRKYLSLESVSLAEN